MESETEKKVKESIKQWLKDNLTIEVKTDTSDFHNTSYTSSTRVEVILLLDGEIISRDSYTI